MVLFGSFILESVGGYLYKMVGQGRMVQNRTAKEAPVVKALLKITFIGLPLVWLLIVIVVVVC